jgi:hypothetical protein
VPGYTATLPDSALTPAEFPFPVCPHRHDEKVVNPQIEKLYGYAKTAEDPNNMRFVDATMDFVPRTAYKYTALGEESDGDICLVMVLADGYNKEELENTPIPPPEERLAQAAQYTLTLGVWPKY